MKKCIFTYCNHQIDNNIIEFQHNVINKFNNIDDCTYEFLRYNADDGVVFPDQVIDYAFKVLFYEKQYDIILMLDIDCIPLSTNALHYVFDKALNGYIIGNIQRSNHISNNEHIYVAPSTMCISKSVFELLDKPSFAPNSRSDIGEELNFIAESKQIPIEMFLPQSFETLPLHESEPWNLKEGMPKYGIGTTFINSNNEEMFYHLFQSRVHVFNQLFYNKCVNILISEN